MVRVHSYISRENRNLFKKKNEKIRKLRNMIIIRAIIEISLKRNTPYNGTVTGILSIIFKDNWIAKQRFFATLENEQYIFPPGVYIIKREYSPKFKTNLWEFKDIKGRSEIKFHYGTKKEHSRGCILISKEAVKELDRLLDKDKIYKIKVK